MGDEGGKQGELRDLLLQIQGDMANMRTSIEKRLDDITLDMNNMKQRMNVIENPPFNPETTLIFEGIQPSIEQSDSDIIRNLIGSTGVTCTVKNLKRLPNRGRGPAKIKCQVNSLEEKIDILRHKMSMKDLLPNVWVRSSKDHTLRVMEQNFKTILKLIPLGEDYYVAGNGLLVESDPDKGYEDSDQQPGATPLMSGTGAPRGFRGGYRRRGRGSLGNRGRGYGRGRGRGSGRGGGRDPYQHHGSSTPTQNPFNPLYIQGQETVHLQIADLTHLMEESDNQEPTQPQTQQKKRQKDYVKKPKLWKITLL